MVKKKKNTLLKKLSKKIPKRKTFKKSKTTLHIKNPEVPSVLGDPNRFFKDEMEEAKNALFFTWHSLTRRLISGGEKIDE